MALGGVAAIVLTLVVMRALLLTRRPGGPSVICGTCTATFKTEQAARVHRIDDHHDIAPPRVVEIRCIDDLFPLAA